ncbi:hypothetical protein DFJ58DRAFT_893326 [Suillus subalutaceus]|uniref:uncharacterized protein n=1 Tax=Suillus subalutaceus TaxID=48586 RepID=UPI001B87C65E|nr:uncharacterized protein DFJ58DRAFT_893326 [Suillus subalutaceus]KAG1845869.1 hypothetical protein DFJ58DRAFT_893326 [Suillus subalutaceus]
MAQAFRRMSILVGTVVAWLHKLLDFQALEELSISTWIRFDLDQALEPFTHSELQSLDITYTHMAHALKLSDLLNALSLPNLHTLAIWGVSGWPHEAFKMFLARSKCPLESLTVCSKMTGDQLGYGGYFVLLLSASQSLAVKNFEGVQGTGVSPLILNDNVQAEPPYFDRGTENMSACHARGWRPDTGTRGALSSAGIADVQFLEYDSSGAGSRYKLLAAGKKKMRRSK